MKTYTDKLVVNMKAEVAWEALKMMDKWLPNLSTNQAIHFEGGEDFFYEGRKYDIVTKEGIKMSCEISEVNEEAFLIEIHTRHSLLHSILNCQVIPLCQLVRTQSYPGQALLDFYLIYLLSVEKQARRASIWKYGKIMRKISFRLCENPLPFPIWIES